MPVQNFQRDSGDAPQGEAAASTSGKPARFEVVFSTGARVERFDYLAGRRYLEELVITPESVNLDRLRRGAPLLNTHASWSLDDVIGVCGNPRIVNGHGIVDVTLSRRAAVAGIVQDLVDGILRNVSVGYSRDKVEKIAPTKDGEPWVYRVTRWQPMEISICPMGADMDAHVGAAKREAERTFPCEVSEITTRGEPALPSNGGSPVDEEEKRRLAAEVQNAERARIADIQKRCQIAKLGDEFARTLIDEGVSGDAIKARVLDAWATRQENEGTSFSPSRVPTNGPMGIDVCALSWDEPRSGSSREDDFRAGAIDGLLLRAGVPIVNPHPAARDFRNARVVDIARMALSMRGKRASWFGTEQPGDIIRRAMSTGDFQGILADATGKSLRTGYETEPASHRAWCREVTVPNFNPRKRAILGSAPDLKKVNEGGEYPYGALDEDLASYSVEKFGRIIAILWEALVNDDLDAFARLPQALGQASVRLEADNVYALLLANGGAGQTMQDTKTLFHADHANLHGSPVSFDSAALSIARVLLRKQKALGGGSMNLEPRYLLVAPERETEAELLMNRAALVKTSTSESPVSEWVSRLMLVVEDRLPSNAFWLAASSGQVDTCESAFLEGEGRPTLERREGFNIDGMEMKVRHVHGARFLDWRGLVKVPLS